MSERHIKMIHRRIKMIRRGIKMTDHRNTIRNIIVIKKSNDFLKA